MRKLNDKNGEIRLFNPSKHYGKMEAYFKYNEIINRFKSGRKL